MADKYKLQIPISNELNERLKKKSQAVGFSSVTEIARVLLTNFANGNILLSLVGNNQEKYSTELSELDQLVSQALLEHEQGETRKLNFDKPLKQQLID